MKFSLRCYHLFYIKTIIILSLNICPGGILIAQNLNQKPILYTCMPDLGPQSQIFFKNNNVSNIPIFDGRYIDPNLDYKVDIRILSEAIINKIPSSESKGIAILDLEGAPERAIRYQSPSSGEFKDALKMYIQVIKLAKRLRPNIEWGFYNIPFTNWRIDLKWKERCNYLMPLLKQCDVLFPSFYISFKSGMSYGSLLNVNYKKFVSFNIPQILILAKTMNKKVLPFVWHRYNVSNKQVGLQLIPKGEFIEFLSNITSTKISGRNVDGLVWWGSDAYYYNIKSKPLISEIENQKTKKFKDYHDSLIESYGKDILKFLKNN